MRRKTWDRGFTQVSALAVAELMRQHDEPTMAKDVARACTLRSIQELRDAGVDEYDLEVLAEILPQKV